MQIITYAEDLKEPIISFIQKIWVELDKTWEPEGRDKDFFNIPRTYQISGGEFWVVLDDKNNVIGTVALKPLGSHGAELKRFYLEPAYRGQGVGKQLLQRAIEKAKEVGFQSVKLDTSKKLTAACALFHKLGFKEIEPYFDTNLSDTFMELVF